MLLLIVVDKYVNSDLKNLLYLIVAFAPFLSILSIFIFYLPFAVYGLLFEHSNFIKKYLFGFSLSFFSAAFIYIVSILTDITINWQFLIFAYYFPLVIVIYKIFRKHSGSKALLSIYKIESKELITLIISLLFLFYVTNYIINNHNMYMSNGTYVYTKFLSVFDGINKFNEVPQYEQRIGQGEQLFLTDTPAFYSNLAFLNRILSWLHPVLFYNSFTVFVIWLSIMGAWLLIYELLSNKNNGYFLHIIAIIGALSIVLSFTFIQFFESFKQSSSYPYDFLALSIIFSVPKKPMHLLSIAVVLMVSFLTHPTKASGVILIAAFSLLLVLLSNNPKEQIREAFTFAMKNKIKLFVAIVVLLLIPVFYLFPGYYYRNYAREGHFPKLYEIKSIDYIKSFFTDKNTNPLSFKYPDLRRIDDKKFGFFFSFFGVISLFFVFAYFRNFFYRKAATFSLAYILHFLASSIITFIPPFQQGEYGYRTVQPYLLVVLVVCIAVIIYNINNKSIKIFLVLVLSFAFVHAAFFVKQNLRNIHSEEIIGGETFKSEINFVKQLPIDGRIITFGMYSNAVDTAMSALTDRYFSRYGYLQWDFEDNTYEKLTRMNSFGVLEAVEPLTSNEFANYFRLTGYKYTFLNVCHPVGAAVLKKLYPENAYPLYQNPNNRCFVILGVNNSYYTEKVDILEYVNESQYKEANGYWYISFNRNKKIHNFNLDPHLSNVVNKPDKPVPLSFKRISPTEVEIYGEFKKDDWVVFKEEYFSRWKAYMEGKEIPLLATNNRMMLVRTNEGKKVILKYSMVKDEKIATFLSLPAIIALIAIFVIAI